MSKQDHDYQASMSEDARDLDQTGEDAAAATHEQTHETRQESMVGRATIIRDVGVMGLLPALTIPVDFAFTRSTEFRELATDTGAQPNGMQTAAHSSQLRMAENYLADGDSIANAQRGYDTLVPLAELATRSLVKARSVRDGIGSSPHLDAKTNAALADANQDGRGMKLAQAGSVTAKAHAVTTARNAVEAAAHDLAAAVKMEVVEELKQELGDAKEKREDIMKKIERAAKFAGYVENLGAAISGAGALTRKLGAVENPNEERVAPEEKSRTEEVGEGVEKAGGPLESLTAFGVGLYYEKDLAQLESQIRTISSLIAVSRQSAANEAMLAKKQTLATRQKAYGEAVEDLQRTINDRRALMGAMGKQTDKAVDKSGTNGDASEALVLTASVLESKALLRTAMDAGNSAQSSVDAAETSVRHNRTQSWGLLSDWMDVTTTPRSDGLTGPDYVALKQMRTLVDWWQQGASHEMSNLDIDSGRETDPVMDALGYHSDY